jgi:hypothetical protein
MQGLNSLRGQYSSPDFGLWGLTEINLGHNGITDAAVDAIMGYAKKDVLLRKLYLRGNNLEVKPLSPHGPDGTLANTSAPQQPRLVHELAQLIST